MRAEQWGSLLCAVIALIVYLNAIPANFAFDDNFAVVYNGDVSSGHSSLWGLLRHDFWGQRIASPQSHKSYRPLTVLSFRLIRGAWSTLPRQWRDAIIARRAASLPPYQDNEAARRGLDPLPFHAANVVWHAVVSYLVCRLAYFLLLRRWRPMPLIVMVSDDAAAARGADPTATPRQRQRDGSAPLPPATAVASAVRPLRTDGAGGGGLRQRSGGQPTSLPPQQQHRPALPPNVQPTASYLLSHAASVATLHAPAWFAGLAFALHPVHTEAVAGVVGHAELLSAALSIPAIMLYVNAAERAAALRAASAAAERGKDRSVVTAGRRGRGNGGGNGDGEGWSRHAAARHWAAVAAAAALAVAAALAKEIGITVIGAMAAADVLLVPLLVRRRTASPPPSAARRLAAVLRDPKWRRLGLLACVGFAYVRLRSWVAVDQLVRIYRKVENPIPFSASRLERTLSTGHLHARYAGLLLAPVHLSADWSFSCVPLVGSLTDTRNLPTVALCGYLLWVLLAARPWGLLRSWWRAAVSDAAGAAAGTSPGAAAAAEEEAARQEARAEASGEVEAARLWGARWRLLIAAGLLVGPFFPASNVLFYVGTFIGERLLYFPSVGFCLLAAEALGCVLLWAQQQEQQGQRTTQAERGAADSGKRAAAGRGAEEPAGSSTGSGTSTSGRRGGSGSSRQRPARRAVRALVYGFMVVVLVSYAVRTWRRNYDWWSEESLFESAEQVCGASAKVQLNLGILARRRGDQTTALAHFRRAREIEPGFCEPAYWIGVSLVNAGDPQAGLPELESALSCKYVAAEALRALHTLFGALHAANPTDPVPLVRWGLLLLRPELPHALGEGCDQLERAAAMYAQRGAAQDATNALGWCLEAVRRRAGEGEAGHARPEARPGPLSCPASPAAAEVAAEVFGASTEDSIGPPPAQLLRCLEARAPLYAALADAAGRVTAPRVRAAAYEYVRRLEELPYCRRASASLAPNTGAAPADGQSSGSSTPHMQLLHVVQAADAEDPWLQAEWGRSLREVVRGQEASVHLSVAGALLQRQLARLQAGQATTARSLADPKRPVGQLEALGGMAAALEEAAALRPLGDGGVCDMWAQAAEARRVLAGGAAAAGQVEEAARQRALLARAVEGLRAAGTVCEKQLRAVQRMAAGSGSGGEAGAGAGGSTKGRQGSRQ